MFQDFKLGKAFSAAQPTVQLMLPFEQIIARRNAHLLIEKITEEDKTNGKWLRFNSRIDECVLEDGRINASYTMTIDDKLKGNLYVAPENVREDGSNTLFLRNGAHSLIVPCP